MNKLLTSATLSLALIAAPAAFAQSQAQDPAQQQANPTAGAEQGASFEDAELRQFVDAQSGINEIRDEYMAKIEEASSQEQAQELQIEANDKMVSVIEDAGLDIPTYNAIATAYNSESGVRDRIDSMM